LFCSSIEKRASSRQSKEVRNRLVATAACPANGGVWIVLWKSRGHNNTPEIYMTFKKKITVLYGET
jgi:hypothetical protein